MLDATEYLHLAINASNKGDHHAALSYLKEALNREPENAKVLYLLAAEYAELGLFDRAIEGMQQCLQLDPNIEMARFQLGLLFAQANKADDARAHWQQLATASDEALKVFGSAMIELLQDDTDSAAISLSLGISKCANNPALKRDMEQLLSRISSGVQTVEQKDESSDGSNVSTVFLGAYRKSAENDES